MALYRYPGGSTTAGVVSASHDTTLRLWNFEGDVVTIFIGHKAIVFSVATSRTGLIASASEDNTARIWHHDGQCIASIAHPGAASFFCAILYGSHGKISVELQSQTRRCASFRLQGKSSSFVAGKFVDLVSGPSQAIDDI